MIATCCSQSRRLLECGVDPEFSEEDVNKLWIALDEELKDIA